MEKCCENLRFSGRFSDGRHGFPLLALAEAYKCGMHAAALGFTGCSLEVSTAVGGVYGHHGCCFFSGKIAALQIFRPESAGFHQNLERAAGRLLPRLPACPCGYISAGVSRSAFACLFQRLTNPPRNAAPLGQSHAQPAFAKTRSSIRSATKSCLADTQQTAAPVDFSVLPL